MFTKKEILYRYVNDKVRYYKINLFVDLFGEYLLIKEYGNIKYKKPTRILQEYYQTQEEALDSFEKKLQEKITKGYGYYV